MRDLAVLFVHLIARVARLLGRGGARSVVAESLLLRHQLLILNRSRVRAPNLRPIDRVIAGLCASLMRPCRLLRSAIVLQPSTIMAFHRALVKRKYRLLFSPQRRGRPGPNLVEQGFIDTQGRALARIVETGAEAAKLILDHYCVERWPAPLMPLRHRNTGSVALRIRRVDADDAEPFVRGEWLEMRLLPREHVPATTRLRDAVCHPGELHAGVRVARNAQQHAPVDCGPRLIGSIKPRFPEAMVKSAAAPWPHPTRPPPGGPVGESAKIG
jgi:hypothetical protein